MAKKIQRRHALTKYASGAVGEAAAAAQLSRLGLRVAKPFWNDDEIDLLILEEVDNQIVLLPVQVKSVQFLPKNYGPAPKERRIQGLQAAHVRKHQGLCLIIFRPDFDEMWIIPGAKKIKELHASQYKGSKKAKKFDDLKDKADVSIKVRGSWPETVLQDYRIPKPDPEKNDHGDIAKVTNSIRSLAKEIKQAQSYAAGLAQLMAWTGPS